LLKNWKSHASTELRFSQGTNLFVGVMGSGKTSVMDAVSFALFGTFPALKSRRVKLEDVIMQRPTSHTKAEVELIFSHEDREYRVVRSIGSHNASEAHVFSNGKLLEAQPQRATELLETVLKMDYDLFARVIYAEQNRIDALLQTAKGERKRQIDELLGLSRFESVRSASGTLTNRLRGLQNEETRYLEGLGGERIQAELMEAKEKNAKWEMDWKNGTIEVQKLGEEEHTRSQSIAELEEKEKRHRELEHARQAAEALCTHRNKELNELTNGMDSMTLQTPLTRVTERIRRQNETIAQWKTQSKQRAVMESEQRLIRQEASGLPAPQPVEAMHLQINDLEKQLKNAQAKERHETERHVAASVAVHTIQQRLREWKEKNERLQQITQAIDEGKNAKEQRLKIEPRVNEAVQSTAELEAETQTLQKALAALQASDSACPTCASPLPSDRKRRLMEEKNQRLKDIQGKKQESVKRKQALERDWNALLKKEADGTAFESQLHEVKQAPDEMKKDADALKKAEHVLRSGEDALKGIRLQCTESEKQIQTQRQATEANERAHALMDRLNALLKTEETLNNSEAAWKTEWSVASLEALEQQREVLQKVERALQLQRKIREHEKEKRDAENALKELAYDSSSLESIREHHQKMHARLARRQESLRNLNERLEEARAQEKKVEEKQREYEERLKRVKQREHQTETVIKFQRSVIETQMRLREELITALNQTMEEIWGSLYPYRDYPAIRLRAKEDDYLLEVQTVERTWQGIENCSGGERSCAALALRVAFAMVLTPGASWIILDEPTHNLDAQAVQRLSAVLREQLPGIVEQTFIVTHDESLKEGASSKAFFFERDKEKGGVTVVEELSALNPSQEVDR